MKEDNNKQQNPVPVEPEGEMVEDELDEITGGADSAGKKYQNQQQTISNYWNVLSNVLKGQSDVQKGISGNIR